MPGRYARRIVGNRIPLNVGLPHTESGQRVPLNLGVPWDDKAKLPPGSPLMGEGVQRWGQDGAGVWRDRACGSRAVPVVGGIGAPRSLGCHPLGRTRPDRS